MKPRVMEIDSGRKGPVFLVFGAVHGDERCGTIALGRAFVEHQAGVWSLEKGKIIMVPVCNPKAYALHQRYIDANLNRVIAPHKAPELYEHGIAAHLAELIAGADILLDLHSYSTGKLPFVFLDKDTPEHRAFAAATGIPHWVSGWNETYAAAGAEIESNDTVSYAHSLGKTAMLVECGTHDDPQSAEVAYHVFRSALAHFGMAAYAGLKKSEPQINKMTQVIVRHKDGAFAKNWQHLDPVARGETVVRFDDGTEMKSPVDGVILLPGKKVDLGDEWFYFGEKAAAS